MTDVMQGEDYDDAHTINEDGAPANPALNRPKGRVSELDPTEQFRILKGQQQSDAMHLAAWRAEATELLGFLAGDQLSPEDRAYLDSQGRPHIVFNRVLTIMKAVAGMEINGRHEIQFLPRNTEDTAVNELLTGASKWMADGADAEDEESQAFYQAGTVGYGWTEQRVSYDDEPDGSYVEEMIDCREMGYDRTAKKKNLSDTRRRWRIRRMPLSEAMDMFPGFNRYQLDAKWAEGISDYEYPQKSLEQKRIRDENTDDDYFDDLNEVTIVHIQWWEREPYWIVADVANNKKFELTDQEYARLSERWKQLGLGELHAVRMRKKKYYQAFLGSEILKKAEPAPLGNRFSWECITGELDQKKRIFFGLLKTMKDPQLWANRFLAQIMQIMNATAKGGIIAERGAFDDEHEAEDGYAQPDSITWVEDGAISGGNRAKIMEKPGRGDPAGYVNLLQFAISSIKDVVGVNLELLGQQDQNQPGILENMRKQAGMTVLATLFDSLRRYRKFIGKSRLYIIQNFLSDGRLIRIVGEEGAQVVPLMREKTTGEYDVIVDDAPTSPNQKEATWAIIAPMLPVFREQLLQNPVVLAEVLSYSPLPAKLVDMLKRMALAQQNDPEIAEKKRITEQLMLQGAAAKVQRDQAAAQKDGSTAALNMAKIPGVGATSSYELAMAENLRHDNETQGMNILMEAIGKLAEARKTQADTTVSRMKAIRERLGIIHDTRQNHADTTESAARSVAHLAGARLDHASADRAEREPLVPAGAE